MFAKHRGCLSEVPWFMIWMSLQQCRLSCLCCACIHVGCASSARFWLPVLPQARQHSVCASECSAFNAAAAFSVIIRIVLLMVSAARSRPRCQHTQGRNGDCIQYAAAVGRVSVVQRLSCHSIAEQAMLQCGDAIWLLPMQFSNIFLAYVMWLAHCSECEVQGH